MPSPAYLRGTRIYARVMPLTAVFRSPARYALRLVSVTAAVVLLLVPPSLRGQSEPGVRSVSGTVVDTRHEPLKGAVVQLENESTSAVTTFVTGADGHFDFKRVSTSDDFRLFATFRNHRSRRKELSRFSSKTAPVVRLVIRLR